MKGQRYTQKIERFWAEKFLSIYNPRFGKQFIVVKHNDQDSPDLECKDVITRESLGLEVKRFASIHSDIRVDSQIAVGKSSEFDLTLGKRGDVELIVARLKELIDEMEDTSFGKMPVALLIPSVFSIWNCSEFVGIAGQTLVNIAEPIKENFSAGVWFFCNPQNNEQSMINLSEF